MSRPIDIDALRDAISAAPEPKSEIPVTRDWLESVERELKRGRAAIAEAAVQRGMVVVTDSILNGARA